MSPAFTAIRAIGTELASRIYWPVIIAITIFCAAIIWLMIWLIMMSAWWWILAVPVFFSILVGMFACVIGLAILRAITPAQSKSQRKLVKDFVDKIQRLSDITQTPKIVLLFRTIRDSMRPEKNGLIQSVIDDTGSLKKDYEAIVDAFSRSSM
jgi:hypothetical protein